MTEITHKKDCPWMNSDCEYKDTHHYCPHEEHKCDCGKSNQDNFIEGLENKLDVASIKYGGMDVLIVDTDTAKYILRQALEDQRKHFQKLITDEIVVCQQENQPTSRLTSLFIKLE